MPDESVFLEDGRSGIERLMVLLLRRLILTASALFRVTTD
jgi:hypothetical protein